MMVAKESLKIRMEIFCFTSEFGVAKILYLKSDLCFGYGVMEEVDVAEAVCVCRG